MARGQRKSVEEKIAAKQELIDALMVRVDSEKAELDALYEEKRLRDLETVSELIEEAGLSTEEAAEALQRYAQARSAELSTAAS